MNASAEEFTPEGIAQQVASGWETLRDNLPQIAGRLLTAVLLIVLGLLALRLGRRIIARVFEGKRKSASAVLTTGQGRTLQSLLTSVFNYVLYFAVAIGVLGTLGVDVSSLLAVAGVGGVAIGFGSQTLVKDCISGMFLWAEGHVQVGDVVTVGDQTGTVEAINLRTTVLRNVNGSLYAVPNGDIRTVVNMSRDFRRALADILVPHGVPLSDIMGWLNEEMEALRDRLALKEPPEVLGVIGMDRFALTIRIQCTCEVDQVWALEREIRKAAMDRLTKEGCHL